MSNSKVSRRSSQLVADGTGQRSSKGKQGDVNMNEVVDENGFINLSVVLPNKQVQKMDVRHDVPMMDLLVQITSSNKLRPGEHSLSAVSEETGRTVDYKSSQSLGSLGVNRVFLLSKITQRMERENEIQKQRDASKFEPTIRVTINLPKGVKSLQRLNPHLPIMDIFRKICIDKGLDASRYEVRLTKLPNQPVDMSQSLSDYQTNEITIVQCSAPAFHSSMVDISSIGSTKMAAPSAKVSDPLEKVKKKKGLFSFFRRDKSKSVVFEESVQDEPDSKRKLEQQGRSLSTQVLPQRNDQFMLRKPQAQVKPQPKVQPSIPEGDESEVNLRSKVKRAPSKKKYKAPAPPRPLTTMEIIKEEKKTTMYASTPNLAPATELSYDRRHKNIPSDARNHSRNSSDSSGYHEPPVTSSDSASSPSTIDTSSLSRTKNESALEDSVLKADTVQDKHTAAATAAVTAQSRRTNKKKAAPAPPPPKSTPPPPSPQLPVSSTEASLELTLHNKTVESEDETHSVSSQNDDSPEMGITSFSPKITPPPIFIPPPPPESPPPAVSESPPRESSLGFGSPTSINDEIHKSPSERGPVHSRSESRCSRASVDTIDDVQQHFDLAIAAGERQLRSEQGAISPSVDKEASKPSTESSTLPHQLEISAADLSKTEAVSRSGHAAPEKEIKAEQPEKSVLPSLTVQSSSGDKGPSKEDFLEAVTQLDASIGEDEGSDGSLVPDGENFVVAASKLPSGGRVGDESDNDVKPVEEITYGFDNPFRDEVLKTGAEDSCIKATLTKLSPAKETLTRRDSQQSDSTLPDSEHTDRPQSSSLQSSSLHSDEESVPESGDGYDTTSTEKVSQSETDTLTDVVLTPTNTSTHRSTRKGLFAEAKGQDINSIIYGDSAKGSVRGFPGQVKSRTASFTSKSFDVPDGKTENKLEKPRPKSVFSIISAKAVMAEGAKARPVSVDGTSALSAVASKPVVSKEPIAEPTLYSRPLPVYNRMTHSGSRSEGVKLSDGKEKRLSHIPPGDIILVERKPAGKTVPASPTAGESKPLGSLLSESMKSGEASVTMRKQPEGTHKPMFFKANRNSRVDIPKSADRIENVVKLDTSKFDVKTASNKNGLPASPKSSTPKVPPPTAAKPQKTGANLSRKGSMKEQYNILQENMARWQNQLKDNENRVKEITASQKNLSANDSSSVSSSASFSKSKPFAATEDKMYQSIPSELHKVTLRSAASRVIKKAEPQLDPVEMLMKNIRDRGGRTSDCAPDRGIYVSSGERDSVPSNVAEREIAPSLVNGALPSSTSQTPVTHAVTTNGHKSPSQKLSNGKDKSNDPRFNRPPSARGSLLAEITSAKGKPNYGRRTPADSSSQSSSDELREIDVVRHKPQKTRHKNSKRSVSDPFPPQNSNNRHHIQPTPTELDPREELMIAIRSSGGIGKLRQVKADEINWSENV